MARENLYQPFEIEYKVLDAFPKRTRNTNFFELVQISEGTGIQTINGNRFRYRKGSMFLVTPQDTHSFEVKTATQFFFLRFNEYYVKTGSGKELTERVEYILRHASHRPGCILKNKADKVIITSLVQIMIAEHANKQTYYNKIIEQFVNTIIFIVARNIALEFPKNVKGNTGETILALLDYIQQNIFVPKALKVEHLSEYFGISIHYLGKYFKKQTGETLQQYILNCKLRLIEARLANSDMRINEIANEFCFADESHLNRIFKKYKGMSPSEFRKQSLQ